MPQAPDTFPLSIVPLLATERTNPPPPRLAQRHARYHNVIQRTENSCGKGATRGISVWIFHQFTQGTGVELPRYPLELQPSTQDPGCTRQQNVRSYHKPCDDDQSSQWHGLRGRITREHRGGSLWRHSRLAYVVKWRHPEPRAIAEPYPTRPFDAAQPAKPCDARKCNHRPQRDEYYSYERKAGRAPRPSRSARQTTKLIEPIQR